MRKWYHIDLGNERWRDKLCKYLRGQRIVFEVHDLNLHYDMWRVRALIADQRQLDDVNRFLAKL